MKFIGFIIMILSLLSTGSVFAQQSVADPNVAVTAAQPSPQGEAASIDCPTGECNKRAPEPLKALNLQLPSPSPSPGGKVDFSGKPQQGDIHQKLLEQGQLDFQKARKSQAQIIEQEQKAKERCSLSGRLRAKKIEGKWTCVGY